MKPKINLYKPCSLTPLQALEEFKRQNPRYKNQKISYPGRLDPMAEGVLLLLIGKENKKMIRYMKLNKQYKAQILFGFSTDSYDILGIPKKALNLKKTEESIKQIKKQIKLFKGDYNQKIPAFSSYKIKGKSLFYYARTNKLNEIEIPEKTVKIKDIQINSIHTITTNRLLKQIKNKISKLKGDFRQQEIINQWEKLLSIKILDNPIKYIIADITIDCSSGTYIRAIANDLGKKINTNAILLNLIRTKVGKYDIKGSIRLKKSNIDSKVY